MLKAIWQVTSIFLFIISIIWLAHTEGNTPIAALPLLLSIFGISSVLADASEHIEDYENRGY